MSDHDHRGQYAEDRHDHDGDYAEKHHRHYDLEREDERLQGLLREIDGQLGQLRRELEGALGRIRALEGQTPQARQLQYEADLAAADLAAAGYDRYDEPEPGDGPDPDRPETWVLGEAPVEPLRPDEAGGCACPETSDGQHCGDWHEGGKCGACGQTGPDPDEDQADEPESPFDLGSAR